MKSKKTKKKTSQKKFSIKNILFWFFVIEHLVIVLFILAALLTYARVYAFSPFGELDKRARSFQPYKDEEMSEKLANKLVDEIPDIVDKISEEYSIPITIEQIFINSFVAQIDIDYISKIYFWFRNENEVYVWILPKEINTAFMVRTQFNYSEAIGIDINITNPLLGAVPLPTFWIGSFEDILENSINDLIERNEANYGVELNEVYTEEEKFGLTFKITDPDLFFSFFLEELGSK